MLKGTTSAISHESWGGLFDLECVQINTLLQKLSLACNLRLKVEFGKPGWIF